ncbi:succinyl-diaminopimelate desuccinylase [Maritimibacter dapengensis]|uniref:Succinyl-diaminopimelate desuccinylase n=1 Tax=Maritimibacter dapengensis TaxID=2836868 RepID=A0ABS6T3N8_9RHOB|nr:succinyl-diaminopimelate desuccinylase [Maritimibacter dapengensis]MBV7379873.1 succinyl-diaminopimelate desuccinylase [Maritimibacter dapengensis]
MSSTDPVEITRRLIQCPSVTPEEAGALVYLQGLLEQAGFTCTRVDRNGIANLFARFGPKDAARTLGFNGHTDVVPVGDTGAWTVQPFGAEEKDGFLWGRGATDMKSGVAAWVAAAIDSAPDLASDCALILAITGDEEGDATDGTRALLDWMEAQGEAMDACIVGEPTSPDRMGEMMKIGRRGSLTAFFTARGVQGHAAYPHRAKNPVPALARLVSRLDAHVLDEGTAHFDPTTLAVTTMDVGNPATNVIPSEARATVNIRFNDAHTAVGIVAWLQQETDTVAGETDIAIEMETKVSGESFLTPPGHLSDLVAAAVEAETGLKPEMSTSGGTSDARFVKDHCPVVEFGLVGKTMHQVDERVEIAQIGQLATIYRRIIRDYFA